jgi:hypothetical protein
MRENRFLVFILGCVSLAWLLNLNFGIVEIPDAIPIIGHIDEAIALAVFVACLSYFGVDLRPWFERISTFFQKMSTAEATTPGTTPTTKGKDTVVDVETETVDTSAEDKK